jgi:hypothetical protein
MSQKSSTSGVVVIPPEQWCRCVRRLMQQAGELRVDPTPLDKTQPLAPLPLTGVLPLPRRERPKIVVSDLIHDVLPRGDVVLLGDPT